MNQTNLKNSPNSSILKEARIAKGLTLEIVHEATKIPMDALKAIEEGYSTRILTPFYYKGFLKIYAEFLGLNSSDVLKEYNVSPPEVKTTPIGRNITKPKAKPASAVKVSQPNALAENFQEFWRTFWTPKTQRLLIRVGVGLVALFLVVKMVGCVAGMISQHNKNAKHAVVKKPVKKEPVRKEIPKAEVKAPVIVEDEEEAPIKESTVAAQSMNQRVSLTVRAAKDTPIQVKSDGKIVFQMTMKKGTVENWQADKQIELSGKNIGDLKLEVNGKDINSLSAAHRKVKRVVITKDGLTVKK
jgi:cytoskeletal protein RodZ